MATGRGRLFEGGDYFKYFGQRGRLFQGGDQSRDGCYSRKYSKTLHFIYDKNNLKLQQFSNQLYILRKMIDILKHINQQCL